LDQAPSCRNAATERDFRPTHAQSAQLALGMWHARERSAVPYVLQRKRNTDRLAMTALLLAAIIANASLVVFVADRLSPKADAAAPARPVVAGNENAPASVKLAA
jgi:hypothetical protein